MSKSARKITFIGAGSTVFAKNLIGDILSFPELADSTICLYDIDENRLTSSEIVAKRIATTLGVPSKIEVTTDRSRALDGATYAINMIQVGGYRPCTVTDFEIPKRYGLRQTIADTLGIGGIMRAVRTIPVLIEMGKEMERLCPDVVHFNYVNPMAMNCWALSEATKIRYSGGQTPLLPLSGSRASSRISASGARWLAWLVLSRSRAQEQRAALARLYCTPSLSCVCSTGLHERHLGCTIPASAPY